MDIATLIDRAMSEKRLNQPELSRRSGVPQATISRTLKGRSIPSTETLIKLFAALDIPMALIEGHEYYVGDRGQGPLASEAANGGYAAQRAVPLLPPAVTIDLDPDCLVVWRQLQQLSEVDREEWRARLDIAAAEARLARLGRLPAEPERHDRRDGDPPPKRRAGSIAPSAVRVSPGVSDVIDAASIYTRQTRSAIESTNKRIAYINGILSRKPARPALKLVTAPRTLPPARCYARVDELFAQQLLHPLKAVKRRA